MTGLSFNYDFLQAIKLPLQHILMLLMCLHTHSAYGQYPVVELSPPGVDIDKLPGYNILNPPNAVNNIDITLTPATIISHLGNGSLLYRFNAPVYFDTSPGSSGKAFIFGPTIRFKRGETTYIQLTNNLTNPKSDSKMQYDIGITNFHTHGLHDSPGQLSQGAPTYSTGDNIFVKINPGESLSIENSIALNHLPGKFKHACFFSGLTRFAYFLFLPSSNTDALRCRVGDSFVKTIENQFAVCCVPLQDFIGITPISTAPHRLKPSPPTVLSLSMMTMHGSLMMVVVVQ